MNSLFDVIVFAYLIIFVFGLFVYGLVRSMSGVCPVCLVCYMSCLSGLPEVLSFLFLIQHTYMSLPLQQETCF